MDEWRIRLRTVVDLWGLAPEEASGIVDELEQHLEDEFAELRGRLGEAAALDRIMQQVNDPALQSIAVRARHDPPISVIASRANGSGWRGLMRDVRYGWRGLGRSPGTTAMAVIALALGIGLTTVMFSIIYGIVLRPLPFEEGDRIAGVMEANPSRGVDQQDLSMHDFIAYREGQKSFETFGAYLPMQTINISGDDRPEHLDAARVTAEALTMTRVRPALGRLFHAEDEVTGTPWVAILSHSVWRDRYAGDSAVVGRIVRMNGQPATIIGVMPEGFGFPNSEKLWVPLRLDPSAAPWGSGQRVLAVGRLRDGVTFAQANAELARIASRIEAEHPRTNEGVRVSAQPYIRTVVRSQIYALLYAMFGAVALVFLVACTNVSNLLLGRAVHRTKEVSIRVALGASRGAIARQFLVEALVLSSVAAAVGAVVAQGGILAFRAATAGTQSPFWVDIRLYPQIFAFIAFTGLVACVVSGFLPAITASRSDITELLKDESLGASSRRGGKLSRGLVIFELALASALLVVAALATKSVLNLRVLEPGFRTHDVMTGRVALRIRDTAQREAFFGKMEEALPQLTSATSVSLSSGLPGSGWGEGVAAVEGHTYARSNDWPAVRSLAVTPGFFETFGVTVLRGRPIGTEDRVGSLPVVIVNQRFVDENFRGSDPIGRRINIHPADTIPSWVTIVGVMPTLYASDPASQLDPWPAELLTAFDQTPHGSASIAVWSAGDPAGVTQPLRALVASLDPDLPVYAFATMSDVLAQSRWEIRVFGGLFIVFGVVALALASIGLYAVLAFSVSAREREMGIRMALGASATDVIRLVVRDAAIQLGIGAAGGVTLGVGAARAARTVFFGVQPSDPALLAVVIGTLAVTGFGACIVPAMRAIKSDPVQSLRSE
jgi:putative ABC transport system permease protein